MPLHSWCWVFWVFETTWGGDTCFSRPPQPAALLPRLLWLAIAQNLLQKDSRVCVISSSSDMLDTCRETGILFEKRPNERSGCAGGRKSKSGCKGDICRWVAQLSRLAQCEERLCRPARAAASPRSAVSPWGRAPGESHLGSRGSLPSSSTPLGSAPDFQCVCRVSPGAARILGHQQSVL